MLPTMWLFCASNIRLRDILRFKISPYHTRIITLKTTSGNSFAVFASCQGPLFYLLAQASFFLLWLSSLFLRFRANKLLFDRIEFGVRKERQSTRYAVFLPSSEVAVFRLFFAFIFHERCRNEGWDMNLSREEQHMRETLTWWGSCVCANTLSHRLTLLLFLWCGCMMMAFDTTDTRQQTAHQQHLS